MSSKESTAHMDTMNPPDRIKRPRLGDVLDNEVGNVRVTWIGRYGRELIVVDAAGREWHLERAAVDHWTRLENAS